MGMRQAGLQGQQNQNFKGGSLVAKKGLLHRLGHRSMIFLTCETHSMQKTFWQGPLHLTGSMLRSKQTPHSYSQNILLFFMQFLGLQVDFSIGFFGVGLLIVQQDGKVNHFQYKAAFLLGEGWRNEETMGKIWFSCSLELGNSVDFYVRKIKISKSASFFFCLVRTGRKWQVNWPVFRVAIFFNERAVCHIYCNIISSCSLPHMSNLQSLTNLQNHYEKDTNSSFYSTQKVRQVYISPFKQTKQEGSKEMYRTSPSRFVKNDHNYAADPLPPRAVPFRRSARNNSSKDKMDHSRQRSGEFKYLPKNGENGARAQGNLVSLEKKLHQQVTEREKWRALCNTNEEQIKVMNEELTSIRLEKQHMCGELLNLKDQMQQIERNYAKASEQIELLNKNLKECRINQKSLANLKNIQNQLELLQQKNNKLTQENEELSKSNKKMRNDHLKKKDSTSQSEVDYTKKEERIQALELEVKRLKEQLHKDRSQRQILLQTNLHELQKKLYEKQNEIKKISIRLNYLDRKKYDSIDQIKTKKDQQIKDLRQRFNKVSKDLKQTKNKIQQTEKKRIPKQKSPYARKIKSSTLLGAASESQQLTFQLSSEV